MHFLCLHGAGTNSRVFEAQTAALRYEIGGNHTYDFVEGLWPCPMDEGIASISSPNEEHFGYYEPHNFKMFRQAQDDLRQYIETDGPFDGVMAFSQGCSVAAAFILELQRAKSKIGDSVSGAQAFKCAVFLAGRPPYIDADLKNTYSGPRGEDMGLNEQISIPTVHIWGRNDRIEPGNALALHNICSREDKRAVVHNGGHEVPGARDKDAVIDSAHVVKRMIASISR